MTKVGIIGLGYVGESLARAISRTEKFDLVGFDSDGNRVRDIDMNPNINIKVSGQEDILQGCEIVVICVPTPVHSLGPNDHYLIAATKAAERNAAPGALVIIESTIAIEYVDKEFIPMMLRSGLIGAYSPERINPGDTEYGVFNTPKLVAGMNEEATEKARDFYSNFVNEVIVSRSMKEVAAAKLLENAYRLLNISFINEFSYACKEAGIDPMPVIDLAGTKPFGFEKFLPGPGAGGHCIPVDPMFLVHHFKGQLTTLEAAAKVNEDQPRKLLSRIERVYGPLDDKRVLVVGMAYKDNQDDVRNAAGKKIFDTLITRGIDAQWHDDHVKYLQGRKSVEIGNGFDVAIITIKHSDLDLSNLPESCLVVDISKG